MTIVTIVIIVCSTTHSRFAVLHVNDRIIIADLDMRLPPDQSMQDCAQILEEVFRPTFVLKRRTTWPTGGTLQKCDQKMRSLIES